MILSYLFYFFKIILSCDFFHFMSSYVIYQFDVEHFGTPCVRVCILTLHVKMPAALTSFDRQVVSLCRGNISDRQRGFTHARARAYGSFSLQR